MEEAMFEVVGKKHKLEVKISNGILSNNILVIEGGDCINMPEVIEQQFDEAKEFISFGYLGVRRNLIEWYRITEVE